MGIVKALLPSATRQQRGAGKENKYDRTPRYAGSWIQVRHLCPQSTQLTVNFGAIREPHTRVWRWGAQECCIFCSLTFRESSVSALKRLK